MRYKPKLRTTPSPCQDMHSLQLCLGQSCIERCTHFIKDSRWDRKRKIESESNQWVLKAPPSKTLQLYLNRLRIMAQGWLSKQGRCLTKHWDVKTEEGKGNHCTWWGICPPASLDQVVTSSKVTQSQTFSFTGQLHLAWFQILMT